MATVTSVFTASGNSAILKISLAMCGLVLAILLVPGVPLAESLPGTASLLALMGLALVYASREVRLGAARPAA